MPGLLSILSAPLSDIITATGNVIDKFVTTPQEKLQAQIEMQKAAQDFTFKMAELEQKWADTQADVIKTEAASQSWLARNWRPMTMMFFVLIIGSIVWTGGFVNGHELDHAFVMKILDIIQYGLSGYVVGRTVEKIAPPVTQIIAEARKTK